MMQIHIAKSHLAYKFRLVLLTLLLSLCQNIVFAQFDVPPIPKEQTSVYDYINLLSASEKQQLEQKLITYSDSTSTQIVIAIIGTAKGENLGLLAPRWAQQWGIGQAKEDNGVFILLAKDDRNIWISPGYGVEDRLTAGTVGEITRSIIIPEFKTGYYYQGLNKGTDAIFESLLGAYKAKPKVAEESGGFNIFILLLVLLIFILILRAASKNNKNNDDNDSFGGGRRLGSDLLETIILTNMGRSSGGSFRGGGFGGGGFSGGFGGGFGGGGFSGGGAGGSW